MLAASNEMKDRVIRDLRTEIIEKAQKIDQLKAKVRQIQKDLHEYILEVEKEREAERSKKNHLIQQLAMHGSAHNLSLEGSIQAPPANGSNSPGRNAALTNSPSGNNGHGGGGGLMNKYSKFSIQERMRKYKHEYETK